MFFPQAGSSAPRRRREPERTVATRLFVPPSTLVKSGGPRLVQDWVDHEALERMKSSSDNRSYNVTGSILNKRKGVTITPRRTTILSKVDTSVPGPCVYAPPPPPLVKPSFNKAVFRPQLPTKQRRSANTNSVSPRFKGMYLRQAPKSLDDSPRGGGPRVQQRQEWEEEEGGGDAVNKKDGSSSPGSSSSSPSPPPLPAKISLYSLMRELKHHFLEVKSPHRVQEEENQEQQQEEKEDEEKEERVNVTPETANALE